MKTGANWCTRTWAITVIFVLLIAAASCGGGSTGVTELDGNSNTPGASNEASANKSSGTLITESEIATLPAWQQEALSDPGWNQPYIPQRKATPVEAPTNEMLRQMTEEALNGGLDIAPRGLTSGEKGASWNGQGSFVPPTPVGKGEYDGLAAGATPPYGCNSNGGNASNGNAVEDLIRDKSILMPQRISYVEEGLTSANWFNSTGGAGQDAGSAVYQLFSTDREADPTKPLDNSAEFAEINYRSDLAPGVGPGGDCSAAEPFTVEGLIWRRFNQQTNALPGGNVTPLYNILIAASGDESAEVSADSGTSFTWQPFYFGTVSECFGGSNSMIVSITGHSGACSDFSDFIDDAASVPAEATFFTNPVYGPLMARWQQTAGAGDAWNGLLGAPVFGPQIFGGGAAQFGTGGAQFYLFGMWFDFGFIYWLDYNQDIFATTPDETQVFTYTGSHVYCFDGLYDPIGTPVFYGGEGPLGVSVTVDSCRADAGDPWAPVPLNDAKTQYQVGIPTDDGLGSIQISATFQGYGGVPNEDCLYKRHIIAWRDGILEVQNTTYDPTWTQRSHTYGSLAVNMENLYVIRCQIEDASQDEGLSATPVRAYGDALPLRVGHAGGGGGGGGDILVVRNDGGTYDTNLNALTADLDAMGAGYVVEDYSASTRADAAAYQIVIWYRGGPSGGEPSPFTSVWTAAEESDFFGIMSDGGNVLLISQQQTNRWGATSGFPPNEPQLRYGHTPITTITTSVGFTENEGWQGADTGLGLIYGAWVDAGFTWFQPVDTGSYLPNGGTQPNSEFGINSLDPAERNDGSPGSGKQPITVGFSNQDQYSYRGMILPSPASPTHGPGTTGGMARLNTLSRGYYSWGNSSAPGQSGAGAGKYHGIGASWSGVNVVASNAGSMDRSELLQNVLAWLNDSIVLGGGGGGGGAKGGAPYDGNPEVVSVTGISWGDEAAGASGLTGVSYPDPSGTNVYRSTDPGGTSNYVIRSTGPSEDALNFNDVDFQFPRWYALIQDQDDSLSSDTISGDELLVAYSGLPVDDPSSQWTRIDDTAVGAVQYNDAAWLGTAGFEIDPVAGIFYTNDEIVDTDANPGNDVPNDATTASYGSQLAHLNFTSTDEPINFEAVAHWDQDDPNILGNLGWSLYPGHTTFNPGTGQYYGQDVPWTGFLTNHDIDPSHPDSSGAKATQRADWRFLRYDFSFSPVLAGGRLVTEFDYGNIDSWNPDMDGDGTPGENPDDKFPVRARLISDLASYGDWFNGLSGWPNAWPESPDTSTQTGGTFREGGCYVVDSAAGSFAGPPVILPVETPISDAAAFNTRWTGTYPASPAWEIDATFEIAAPNGADSVAFDLNADLPVDAGNFDADVTIVEVFTPGVYTRTLAFTDVDVSNGWSNGDLNFLGARAQNGAGEGFASFANQIWLGDIIGFYDYETNPSVTTASVNSSQTVSTFGSFTADHHSEHNKWFETEIGENFARWTTSTNRTDIVPQQTNMLDNYMAFDHSDGLGTGYHSNSELSHYMPPAVDGVAAGPLWQHARMAFSIDFFDSVYASYIEGSDIFRNNLELDPALQIFGPTLGGSVVSFDLEGGDTFQSPRDASGNFRAGFTLFTDSFIGAKIPGGFVFDNLLHTHASTAPAYL